MIINFTNELEFNELDDEECLEVHGISCNSGYVPSKHIIIKDEELSKIAKSLSEGIDGNGAYILKDHVSSVDSAIGRISNAQKIGNSVFYNGKIQDEGIAQKIKQKIITASSVGLVVENLTCSVCGRNYDDPECLHLLGEEYPALIMRDEVKPYLEKNIASWIGHDFKAREQSIVLYPAIGEASINALSFDAESDKMIQEMQLAKSKIVEERSLLERLDKIEETLRVVVDALVSTDVVFAHYDEVIEEYGSELKELKMKRLALAQDNQGSIPMDDPIVPDESEAKEDLRQLMFGIRKDGKPKKNLRSLRDIKLMGS